jgi:hypothetical protein
MAQTSTWLSNMVAFLFVMTILDNWRMNILPHTQFVNNLFGGLYALTGFLITLPFKQELAPALFYSVETFCAIGFIFYLYRLIKTSILHPAK